jgi:hypothetical protein
MSKLQFVIKKLEILFQQYFLFLVIKTLDLDPDLDLHPVPQSALT